MAERLTDRQIVHTLRIRALRAEEDGDYTGSIYFNEAASRLEASSAEPACTHPLMGVYEFDDANRVPICADCGLICP